MLFLSLFLSSAFASPQPTELPVKLATRLSAEDIAQMAKDEQKFPEMMKFLKTVDVRPQLRPSDLRNRIYAPVSQVFVPNQALWEGFFKAAIADKLTVLRAFALLGREVKRHGVVLTGPGAVFERTVEEQHIDMGLAIPAKNIAWTFWTPDPKNPDPEFQCHLKVFYSEPLVHRFPDEILPADLKVGFGDEAAYWADGKEIRQHTLDVDIYYGPKNGIGFRNTKGVGGQKRGFLGIFQKILFFLPDAVDSMVIDEKNDTMVTEALVNTTVEHFESNPLYSIKKTN